MGHGIVKLYYIAGIIPPAARAEALGSLPFSGTIALPTR